MAALGSVAYDPAGAVSKSTATLIAMTAFDTTNLRVSFTVPASGKVLVKARVATTGATTLPRILLGVLEGSTVRLRMTPMGAKSTALATDLYSQEVVGLVTGLTPAAVLNWDLAYSVEGVIAATNVKYGGPNDAAGADAFGAAELEVWDTTNLLAGTLYDPAAAATLATTSLLAMTAMDTTNLRLTFTAPASGNVFWRVHTQYNGSATRGQVLLGILDGATVRARVAPVGATASTGGAPAAEPTEASGIITGLTPGNSFTWDAAYAVQVVAGAGGLKHGGPDNTTTNDAFGGTAFEIWTA